MAVDGHLNFDTKLDEKGFSSGISKLGSIAKGGLAILGGSIAGITAAFGGLSKAALDSVASLEQNVGGIETLFKDSAQTVIDNANNAYKTAGMSANEYMQNVTSFSASLLQSVAGDTAEAAKIADMAMVDMSDNANKMGTDMEAIQNAYQGFAKQNYTMLDNLKLGYGGTKTEMLRLLDDATKLSGVEYDIGNLKDVYSAIHVIQEDLDITGTTAKEAATTIEGSMASAKAAFDNFLNGSGSVDELADSIVIAAENIGKNLAEIVPRLLETIPLVADGIGEAVEENSGQIAQAGSETLTSIISGAVGALPQLAEFGISVINTLILNVNENLPLLLTAGGQLLITLINGVTTLIPSLASLGMSIISTIAQGLVQNAPTLQAQATAVFGQFNTAITTQLPLLLEQGAAALGQFIQGILSEVPELISNAGDVISQLLDTFLTVLPDMMEAGVSIIENLVLGVWNNLPSAIGAAAETVIQIAATIASHLPEILQKGIELIGQLIAGMISAIPDIIASIPQIIAGVADTLMSYDWLQIGKDIVTGIANGLKSSLSTIIDAAASVGEAALNGLKDLLGIHSPSRVFRDEVGKNIALGIAEGIQQNKKYAKKSADEIAQATLKAAQDRLDNYKVYNSLTLVDEAAYWDSVRQQVQEGTQARIDADKEYFKAKQDLNDKMADAEEDYTKKVAAAYEKLNDEIQSLNQEYRDAVNSRTEEIAGAYGLFDEFSMDTDLTSDDLLGNLQSQVDGLEQWMDNLDELSDRGVGDDLIAELQELGPQSAAQVQLLTEMTDDQLDDYVNLFRRKNRLARSQALEELEPMQTDIQNQIEELKRQTRDELADYQQEYIAAMAELGVALNQPVENLKLLMAQNAVEMVAALAQSIQDESGTTENTERFQAIADNILNASDSLPSDLLYIGQTAIDSMAQGIMSRSGVLAQAVDYVTSLAGSQALASLSGSAIDEALYGTEFSSGPDGLPASVYGNEGYGPGYQLDYARMGEEMAAALDGMDVSMDGQKVGSIVSEPVNDNLGDRSRMEERDIV